MLFRSDAAVAVGVRHVVNLSALGPTSRLKPFAWHMKIEAHLASQPMASTVVRPPAFADILKCSGPQLAAGAGTGAAGGGHVNFINTRDIAKVVRVALFEDASPESQRACHLTGQRRWTMHEVAALSGWAHRLATSPARPRSGEAPFWQPVLGETTLTVRELTGYPPSSGGMARREHERLHELMLSNPFGDAEI